MEKFRKAIEEDLGFVPKTRLYQRMDFDPALLSGLAHLTADATGEPFDKIGPQFAERAPVFDFIVTIEDESSSVGYGGYRIITTSERLKILYESAKMIFKSSQGKGYGRQITRSAMSFASAEFIAARTQNPAEVLSIQRALDNSPIAPIQIDFRQSPSHQEVLRQAGLALGIGQLLDLETGLCEGMYGERFGDYIPLITNEDINLIVGRFNEIGLKPERGDAILLIGETI